jgi:hypothetical protein
MYFCAYTFLFIEHLFNDASLSEVDSHCKNGSAERLASFTV